MAYSSTSLAKKLGIKRGFKVMLVDEPKHYFELFSDWPEDIETISLGKKESIDFIHIFCTELEQLEANYFIHKPLMKKNGLMWISWPKGKSHIITDLNRDIIRRYILDRGLVDVKVAAIDNDWSGLKFVYRIVDR